jgi:outer membrane autotransporter protein
LTGLLASVRQGEQRQHEPLQGEEAVNGKGRSGHYAWVAATTLIALGAAAPARAQYWTGAISSDWHDAGNWDSGVLPGPGATVMVTTAAPNTPTLDADTRIAYLSVGHNAGTYGALTVTDGATAQVAGEVHVGRWGTGSLRIENGGSMRGAEGRVGNDVGANGSVVVTGAGSSWDTVGYLVVGNAGRGALTIADGARVSAMTFYVGFAAGGDGTVNIGAPTGQSPVAPGTLSTPAVYFSNGTGTLNFNHTANDYTFAPALAGSGTVNVAAGTTTFEGAGNTFNGPVNISGGKAVVGRAGALGTGPMTLGSGELVYAVGGSVPNAFTFLGGQTARLSAAAGQSVSLDGSYEISQDATIVVGSETNTGTVSLGSGGTRGVHSGNALIVDGGTLRPTDGFGGMTTYLAGSSLTVNTRGTYDLNGLPTRTARLAGSGTITNNGALPGDLMLTSPVASAAHSFSGTIADGLSTTGVQALGGSQVTLSGTNTYSGPTVINGSSLVAQGGHAIGDRSAVTVRNASTLRVEGDETIGSLAGGASIVTVTEGHTLSIGADNGSATFTGATDGAGALTKVGTGTQTLGGAGALTGATTVAGGTLALEGGMAIRDDAAVAVRDGATLAVLMSETIGSLAGTAGATVSIGDGHTLAIGAGGMASRYSGMLSGGGSLAIVGSGTTTLDGVSSFTGTTTIASGGLRVDGTLAGAVAVGAGGTLSGTGTIAGAVTVDGTLSAGNSPGTLTVGSLALNSGATSVFELNTPGAPGGTNPATGNDLVRVTGDLSLGGTLDARVAAAGYYRLFEYGGTLHDAAFDNTVITPTAGGFTAASHQLQTNIGGQVNLSVLGAGQQMQFWDGADGLGDGAVGGGAGTWGAATSNWTGAPGQAAINDQWRGSVGVFGAGASGSGGAVAVAGTEAFDTLQFSANGYALSGGTLAIAPASGTAGMLSVDNGVTATVASTVADGTGTVLGKVGGGTLVLAGANTHTGGTQVLGGTLRIAADSNLGAPNGGLLLGGGTLNTTADIVTGRALQLAGVGRLDTDDGTTLTLTGDASGVGSLAKTGAGTLILAGRAVHTGGTSVSAGTLSVTGTLGGALDVQAGGTLAGAGTVGSTTVSGTLAPGLGASAPVTLTVGGDLTFQPGSTYSVRIDPALHADTVAVQGRATLNGGTVGVSKAGGVYKPGSRWTVLSASGGITGTFAAVTETQPYIGLSLGYDANHAYLLAARNDVGFCLPGFSANQCASANGAESLGQGPLYDAIASQASEATAAKALDQLSGEMHASSRGAMIEDSRYLRDAVYQRLRQVPDAAGDGDNGAATAQRGAAWGHVFGSWASNHGKDGSASIRHDTGGAFVGADAALAENLRIGALAGYSYTSYKAGERNSSGHSDNYHLGLYGGGEVGRLALRSGLAYTWQNMSTRRAPSFEGFSDQLRAEYQARTAQVFGELGYGLEAGTTAIGRLTLEPFANLAYVNLSTDGFTEQGGVAALRASASHDDVTFTTAGLRAATTVTLANGIALTAGGTLGWRHAFGGVIPVSTLAFAGGTGFNVAGAPVAADAAVIEAGVEASLSRTMNLAVSYAGQVGAGVQSHGVRAKVNWRY